MFTTHFVVATAQKDGGKLPLSWDEVEKRTNGTWLILASVLVGSAVLALL